MIASEGPESTALGHDLLHPSCLGQLPCILEHVIHVLRAVDHVGDVLRGSGTLAAQPLFRDRPVGGDDHQVADAIAGQIGRRPDGFARRLRIRRCQQRCSRTSDLQVRRRVGRLPRY